MMSALRMALRIAMAVCPRESPAENCENLINVPRDRSDNHRPRSLLFPNCDRCVLRSYDFYESPERVSDVDRAESGETREHPEDEKQDLGKDEVKDRHALVRYVCY